MIWLILLSALLIIFLGLGFLVKTLFYVAVILALLWLIVLFVRGIKGR